MLFSRVEESARASYYLNVSSLWLLTVTSFLNALISFTSTVFLIYAVKSGAISVGLGEVKPRV